MYKGHVQTFEECFLVRENLIIDSGQELINCRILFLPIFSFVLHEELESLVPYLFGHWMVLKPALYQALLVQFLHLVTQS